MNLLNIVAKGGWLMIPIFICSFIAAAIIVERFVTLKRASTNTRHLMLKLKSLLAKGNIDEAIELCAETPGAAAKVLQEGIVRAHLDKETIHNAIEAAGKEEIFNLEKNMGVLATIAGVAPLIGFLGTVTGMINAFMEIERLSGNVNATVLAGGIWEALMTTAAGLAVGIPTYIFYNYLTSKIQHTVFEMESSSNELVEMLTHDKQASHF